MMTSRERVLRCLEFDHPDRVPRDAWALPAAWTRHGQEAMEAFIARWPGDFGRPEVPNPKAAALELGNRYAVGQHRDAWGCVFENIHGGVIGQVKQPIIDDWAKLAELRPPVEALEVDVAEVNRRCAASEKFMLGDCCPRPFERIQFLRGTERLLMDLAKEPAELHELLRRVHEFYCRELEVWARTDVDGLMFMDDWGSQANLLISPRQFRRMFKPLYAEYVQIMHGGGKKAFMHSDGYITPIVEDLIEVGVDALNSQVFCMDVEELGRRFGGRITFWGEIDRQHVLTSEDPRDVRAAVERVVEHLYRPEGGVIAQFEMGQDTPMVNADAVFAAWEELTAGRAV